MIHNLLQVLKNFHSFRSFRIKIKRKYSTHVVMSLVGSNHQPHTIMLPVSKGLKSKHHACFLFRTTSKSLENVFLYYMCVVTL